MRRSVRSSLIPLLSICFLLCLSASLPLVAAGARSGMKGASSVSFSLRSPDFTNGGDIPKQLTCAGEDRSPALAWNGAPAGTKSFALIADDPDAPGGTWVHWVIFNIPSGLNGLAGGMGKKEQQENGARQGRNDFGKTGYNGPCPPPGKPHRYFFKLYALNAELALGAGATKAEVESAMEGHIVGEAE